MRRLAAHHGMPKVVLSDNHRTFMAAETFLMDLQRDPEVQDFVASRGITWLRQTPRAPWQGGHFERLVRTIKVALAPAIAKKLLSYAEFSTIVKEVQCIVNNRPLTYQSSDLQDVPLTPSQLIFGRNLQMFPILTAQSRLPDEGDDGLRKRYVVLASALATFRRRWKEEYLTALREKHVNRCATAGEPDPLREGEVVLVRLQDDNRADWPLGIVQDIYRDAQGVARSALIRVGNVSYKRAVEHICPLEMAKTEIPPVRNPPSEVASPTETPETGSDVNVTPPDQDPESNTQSPATPPRPIREAVRRQRTLMRHLIEGDSL